MSPDNGAAGFASFIPLFLMGIIFGILAYFIVGKRKGKNPFVCFLLCLIPGFGAFYIIYLASLTDKTVLDRLDHLENLLKVYKKTPSAEPT